MANKRWSTKLKRNVRNQAIDEFIEGVVRLSREFGLSISHEDAHGAFIIERFDENNVSWLRVAMDGTESSE